MQITEEMIVDHITKGHLDHFGGYPFDYAWHERRLFVAAVVDGENETSLVQYTREQIDRWLENANKAFLDFEKEEPDDHENNMFDAIVATHPEN